MTATRLPTRTLMGAMLIAALGVAAPNHANHSHADPPAAPTASEPTKPPESDSAPGTSRRSTGTESSGPLIPLARAREVAAAMAKAPIPSLGDEGDISPELQAAARELAQVSDRDIEVVMVVYGASSLDSAKPEQDRLLASIRAAASLRLVYEVPPDASVAGRDAFAWGLAALLPTLGTPTPAHTVVQGEVPRVVALSWPIVLRGDQRRLSMALAVRVDPAAPRFGTPLGRFSYEPQNDARYLASHFSRRASH